MFKSNLKLFKLSSFILLGAFLASGHSFADSSSSVSQKTVIKNGQNKIAEEEAAAKKAADEKAVAEKSSNTKSVSEVDCLLGGLSVYGPPEGC
ncbi:TPA: hypothetical protein G9F26_003952 [Salmonella enterica]|uniref:Secreted protein n=1 Tax=Salmonella enterica TaxID=28901 RepID=A0A750I1B7_SALER|nr:hypothetical protein [Salmonella enterica]